MGDSLGGLPLRKGLQRGGIRALGDDRGEGFQQRDVRMARFGGDIDIGGKVPARRTGTRS